MKKKYLLLLLMYFAFSVISQNYFESRDIQKTDIPIYLDFDDSGIPEYVKR